MDLRLSNVTAPRRRRRYHRQGHRPSLVGPRTPPKGGVRNPGREGARTRLQGHEASQGRGTLARDRLGRRGRSRGRGRGNLSHRTHPKDMQARSGREGYVEGVGAAHNEGDGIVLHEIGEGVRDDGADAEPQEVAPRRRRGGVLDQGGVHVPEVGFDRFEEGADRGDESEGKGEWEGWEGKGKGRGREWGGEYIGHVLWEGAELNEL